jgi:ABC-type amino acid transport substrate-binding protein
MKTMKKLLTAFALVAFVATPTFAATYRSHADRNVTADQAYAAAPGFAYTGSGVVVAGGKVIGADPDANVRLMLQKAQTGEVSQ